MKAYLLFAFVTYLILPLRAANDIFSVQNKSSTPNTPENPFASATVINHLNDDSSVAASSFVFSPGTGIYGATILNGDFYAIDKENGTFVDYLAIIPHTGPLVGRGARAAGPGTSPIGFPDLEALVNVNDTLIGSSVDLPGHVTRFVSIDLSGVGTLIGPGSTDVMIFGLAYDPVGGVLYGAGKANATVGSHNLYIINPATGATTLVGPFNSNEPDPGPPLSPVIQSLSWSDTHGLIGAFDHLYSISTTTGVASQIGAGDYTDGLPGTFNGVYALAAIPPPAAPPAPFRIISITRSPAGVVDLEWTSETGYNFQVKFGTTLSTGAFTPVTGLLPGTPGTMTSMHSPGDPKGFYLVEKTTAP